MTKVLERLGPYWQGSDQDILAAENYAPCVVGWDADYDTHIERIKAEFGGKPALCYKLACVIVQIRREMNLVPNIRLFRAICCGCSEFLCHHMPDRWLVSICDTFADYSNKEMAPAASLISTFMNMLRLGEGVYFYAGFPRDTYKNSWPRHLWGGMTTVHLTEGNMMANMITRIRKVLEPYFPLNEIFEALLMQAKNHALILQAFAKENPEFYPDDS